MHAGALPLTTMEPGGQASCSRSVPLWHGLHAPSAGAPRSKPDWGENNPRQAAREWVRTHPDFVIEEPAFVFNEGLVRERVTYWPGGFLRRVR